MFLYYDRLYFGGVLTANAVVVEWSKRMTLCAGQVRKHMTGAPPRTQPATRAKLHGQRP
jgi:hypothetical protein